MHVIVVCVRLQVRKVRHVANQNFHSNRIGGLGATYAVHLRLIGKLIGDFLLVIIELFSLGAFVLSQYRRLMDGQPSIARCDLTNLDVHKNEGYKRWS